MQDFHQIPEWNRDVEALPVLGPAPAVHATATVLHSRLGAWTEVGAFAELIESSLGDYSYVAPVHASLTWAEVGKFCSLASSVRLNPVNHPVGRVTQHHCTYRRRQYGFDERDDAELFAWRKAHRVTVGHDVWIGHGATVMPGVTIGTGAVVGAGAVATRDVEPYTVVVGVPARPLRRRFSDAVCDQLLASAWWDWDHATLRRRFAELLDLDQFLAAGDSPVPVAAPTAD